MFVGKANIKSTKDKLIINLLSRIAEFISEDPDVKKYLQVKLIRNCDTTFCKKILAASDLYEDLRSSEDKSNILDNARAAYNGTITIGTLNHINKKFSSVVGNNNFYAFGLSLKEILNLKLDNNYNPQKTLNSNSKAKMIINIINSYSNEVFKNIVANEDQQFLLADLESYISTKNEIINHYTDYTVWNHKSILNIARSYDLISDKTATNYASKIWGIDY